MKKIFFLFLLLSTISYGQFEPMLWKISGTNIVPSDTTLKVPAKNLPVGTSANNLVQLDGNAKIPPLDGSQLTGLPVTLKVVKYNDETLSNVATYQDDDELFLNLAANKSYILDFKMVNQDQSYAPNGIRVQLVLPSGGTFALRGTFSNGSNMIPGLYLAGSGLLQLVSGLPGYPNKADVWAHGLIKTTNAGVLKVQWCQYTAHSDFVKLLAGAYITLQQVN